MTISAILNSINRNRLNLALLVLSGALLPFLLLAIYCHPSADDFWLTNLAIEKGPWQAQQLIRQNWSGRYTAMFLGSINPLVFRSFFTYKLLPVFMLVMLGTGLYWLVRESSNYQLPRKITLVAALVLLVLYLHQMPTVAQTIYWMSGSLTYQTGNILLLLLLAALLRYGRQLPYSSQKIRYLTSLVLFAAIGCNETSMAIIAFLIGLLVAGSILQVRRIDYFLLWLFAITILSCCLVVFAPGNAVRGLEYPQQHDLPYALTYALLIPVNNSLNWLVHSPILPLTILCIPFFAQWQVKHPVMQRLHPVAALGLLYGSLAAGYFVSYWSKHHHAPPRAQDVMYFVFLLGWFFNVMVAVHYFTKKYSLYPLKLPTYVVAILTGWIIIILFYAQSSNIRTAYRDLLSGEAARYNQEMNSRYAALRSSNCLICPIKAARYRPQTIFFEEVPADSSWENTYYARYFGKKLLVVSE